MNKIIISVITSTLFLSTIIYIYQNSSRAIITEPTSTGFIVSPTPPYNNGSALLAINSPIQDGVFDLSRIDKVRAKEYIKLNANISVPKSLGYVLRESFFGDNLNLPGCVSPTYDPRDGISEERYKSCRLETEESGITARYYFINDRLRIVAEIYDKAKFKNLLNCVPIKDISIIGSMCFQQNEYDYVAFPVFTMTTVNSPEVLVFYGAESFPLSGDDINVYYNFISKIEFK